MSGHTLAELVTRLAGSTRSAPRALPRASREPPIPLSFAQQRLWFLSQLEPGSPLYNIAGVARLRGHLEVSTLSRVLELQVARHEVFRTSFAAVDGVPRASVAEHVPFTLPDGVPFPTLAAYDDACAAAGLRLVTRTADWAGEEPYEGGGYAVSVHEKRGA